MKSYDVIIGMDFADVVATFEADDDVPAGVLLQALIFHPQLVEYFVEGGINGANTLLITTRKNPTMSLNEGLTVVFQDGAHAHGALESMATEHLHGVPDELEGRTLMRHLSVQVQHPRDGRNGEMTHVNSERGLAN